MQTEMINVTAVMHLGMPLVLTALQLVLMVHVCRME
jgi:hypothetical protein